MAYPRRSASRRADHCIALTGPLHCHVEPGRTRLDPLILPTGFFKSDKEAIKNALFCESFSGFSFKLKNSSRKT